MAADQIRSLVEVIGAVLQMAAAVILLVLMLLLQLRMRVRHFDWWTAGWALLTIAVIAASARIVVLPLVFDIRVDPAHPMARAIAAVYQVAKVGALALFLRGALAYADRTVEEPRWMTVFAILLGGGALSVVLAGPIEQMVRWQAPLATMTLGFCAALLLGLPAERRGFGTRVTGIAFAAGALLWASYIVAFRLPMLPQDLPGRPAFALTLRYNAFADLLFATALGIGMVVLLLEDAVRGLARAKREADAAAAELAGAHQRLRLLATTDALTGCMNRQGLQEWLDSPPYGTPEHGAVLVLDMDNLKPVNDVHGHGAGDAMLRQLAAVLAGVTAGVGALCRWGGDEFLLVVPGLDPVAARDRCELALVEAPPLRLAGSTVSLRLEASVGAAGYDGLDDVPSAIRRADGGMYRHKQKRRMQSGAYPATLG